MLTSPAKFEPVIVAELFTSQGCSSCPPADRLLAKTVANAEKEGTKFFALSFHVDYWDRLGWKDPFSSAASTQRQSEYVNAMNLNSSYTPQMIINGKTEFTGSDDVSLSRAMSKARSQAAAADFTKLTTSGKGLTIQYQLDGDFAGDDIHFALVSLREMTEVRNGENAGRSLGGVNIVRQFITRKAAASGEISFAAMPAPAAGNAAVIAYLQQRDSGIIKGAAEIKLLN